MLKDFPDLDDIIKAELDAWTIYDILIHGLGLLPKNVKLIANPTNKDMMSFDAKIKAEFKKNSLLSSKKNFTYYVYFSGHGV